MKQQNDTLRGKVIIIIISIFIPTAVALLFFVKLKDFGFNVEPLTFLPPIYAGINALTAIVLILAIIAIRNGHIQKHKRLMTTAIILSICFLVLYIAYHITSETTKYGGEGVIRYAYFFLLVSHIILSIAVIPLVMITYIRALSDQFDQHKKIAKITFPIWLYVAITGVIVYFMIVPYYA